MPKKAALLIGILSLFAIAIAPVSAHHREEVLGYSTAATDIVFPPVSAGPGYFLPDSPLYVLDKAFQSFRLAVAFKPERRVVVRNLILGERLAELRVMTERGNEKAINAVLQEMTNESYRAASDLADAEARGEDVAKLAKDTNDLMRLHRETLKSVTEQADDALAFQFEAARQSMLLAKMHVEDQLSEQELAEAIENDLEDELETHGLIADASLQKLEQRLDYLDVIASRSDDEETSTEEVLAAKAEQQKDKKKQQSEEKITRKRLLQQERRQRLIEAKEQAKKTREALERLRDALKSEKNVSLPSLLDTLECDPTLQWENHGAYVSCVARQKAQKKVSEAAKSNVGKENATKTPTPTITPLPTIVVE